jgi:hypothetical protein
MIIRIERLEPAGAPAIARPDTGRIPLDIFKIIIHCGLVMEPEPEGCAHGTPKEVEARKTAQGNVVVDDFSGFSPDLGVRMAVVFPN